MKEKLGADVIKTKWNARDLLTEIDPMCQQIISDIVLAEHPSHAFLGEESVDAGAEASGKATNDLKDSEWLWVVDPIDGTTNFVSGMPLSAVSIGVARRGELVVGVIVDPFRDEVFSAALGKGAFMNGEAIRVGEESDIGDAVIAAGSPPNMRSITPSIRGVSALMPKCRTIRMIGSAALHFAWIANGRLTAYWEADLNSWDTAAGAVLVSEAGGEITDLRGDAFGLTTRPVLASNGRTHAAILAVLTEAQVFGLDPP